MTTVRLAVRLSNAGARVRATFGQQYARKPAILASYAYHSPGVLDWIYPYVRDWAMDSGAYTAHTMGKTVSLDAFTAKARELLDGPCPPSEVFALDVIGDWRASLANTDAMWAKGVPAIPTYHYGSPWSVLVGMAKDYPKIALGGSVGMHKAARRAWVEQCFARIWPARVHGLGILSAEVVNAVPFHSVDASNWDFGPSMGRWSRFGDLRMKYPTDLGTQVAHYLDIEARLSALWAKEMAQLAALPDVRRGAGPAAP